MRRVYIVLYEDFTALDVFGPVEVLGNIDDYEIHYISLQGGVIKNKQGIKIITEKFSDAKTPEVLLIPGGFGSRIVIENEYFIASLKELISNTKFLLCVCTGSALAAKTGLLDEKSATSNKTAFEWVKSYGTNICWKRQARWVRDGNIYTSAGVSAGTDMALGFIKDQFGKNIAEKICRKMEYHWNSNAENDIF